MEQLLEDYKRRLKMTLSLLNLKYDGNNAQFARLKTKAGCYRTFISELEREINNLKTIS